MNGIYNRNIILILDLLVCMVLITLGQTKVMVSSPVNRLQGRIDSPSLTSSGNTIFTFGVVTIAIIKCT